ncbi:hypothetical protein [Crenothrix polyspora]|uniref:hypothetical protein n=1 Tax=Crenothrix polyspora TaxID=360316 RepID=UPI000B34BEE7|nr:hypothetical protein [Crenothrix polyspora]
MIKYTFFACLAVMCLSVIQLTFTFFGFSQREALQADFLALQKRISVLEATIAKKPLLQPE